MKFLNPFRYTPQVWLPPENYSPEKSLDEIKKIWGKNKIIPKHLEDIFYQSMAYYPELIETHFIVVETRFYGAKHTLRAYPPLLSLPNKRKDRVYPVVINTDKKVPISFYSLTHEEKLGALAHELAHTVDYTKRTSLQIIGVSFNVWVSKNFIKKFERSIDLTAVKRGCGKFLFSFNMKKISQVEKNQCDDLVTPYLRPEEIESSNVSNESPSELDQVTAGIHSPVISKILYATRTALSFFPAIGQMMYLVYIRKMHKKPDWYKK